MRFGDEEWFEKLRDKLKDPGVKMQIVFSGTLIFLYIALVRSGR